MRDRRFFSRAAAAAVSLVAVLGLSACRVDTVVTTIVNDDGSGTVAVVATADAEAVAAEPNLAKELVFTDLEESGWSVTGPTPTDDNGLTITLIHEFENLAQANEILASLSGPDGPILEPLVSARGTKGEVHWSFAGSLDFSKGLKAFSDQELLAAVGRTPWIEEISNRQLTPSDVASVTFKLSLPGEPEGDRTAGAGGAGSVNEWTVRPGDAALDLGVETVQISSGVKRARSIEGTFVAVLIVYVLVLAGLVSLWFYARSRRRRARDEQPTMKVAELVELDPDERRVMRYLLRFPEAPTAAELAAAVGIPVKELKDHVRSLMRAGLATVEEGRIKPVLGKRSSRIQTHTPRRRGDDAREDRWSKLDQP